MIRIAFTLCLLISLGAYAQYYYKDLVTTRQTNEKTASYKAAKVQSVNITSVEKTGEQTEDFSGSQKISSDFTRIYPDFSTPGNATIASRQARGRRKRPGAS